MTKSTTLCTILDYVKLATMALPITRTQARPKNVTNDESGNIAGMAATSIASDRKFDRKFPREKPAKKQGKHRKVELSGLLTCVSM
ncbi:hypothetical protein PVK06_048176 [Gossypium arboreum]|uniref:Uncharacterized protein n=1 Tax=Gossypium arboreum TaxID=29729 RepID=A0ABR0MH71_GOSAR|nr:hypothetical protein PVK06_048176 [Gossypium arboreum]